MFYFKTNMYERTINLYAKEQESKKIIENDDDHMLVCFFFKFFCNGLRG